MRDYSSIAAGVRPGRDRQESMRIVVDALWQGLSGEGVSWVGFYAKDPHADEMTLCARRDKPACSPIGLHGVCGQAWQTRQPQLVNDVMELGGNYVACDPRDRSEVVLPLFESNGECWGVLDLDSFDVGAFDQSDVDGLTLVLARAGFRTRA